MEKNPLFKFELTKVSADEIKIDIYNRVDRDLYSHTHLLLAISTIPEFINRINNKQAIYEYDQLMPIKNDIDTIEFKYSGCDMEPLLTAIGDHKRAIGEIDEGLIDIPLDFMGREEENMEYIIPLVMALQKYVP